MPWPGDPRDARVNYSLLKRPDLERTLQEQSAEIDGMKQVFYRETDALREQLQVLNAENRALKAAAEGRPLPPPQAAPRVDEEELFKERMKPIIAKLVQKQREELSALRVDKELAQRELEQTQRELAGLRSAFRETNERARELSATCEAIKAQRTAEEAHSPHIQEYQRALAAAQEQNARQEETIQALTRQLDASAAHYRSQRAQALEYLKSIRESFELFSQCMAPEEAKPAPARIKPLFIRDTGK